MTVSYKKLWKLLIDKDMMKKDLQVKANISWATVTKMSKNETVSMEVLMKICQALDCRIEDIVEFIPDGSVEVQLQFYERKMSGADMMRIIDNINEKVHGDIEVTITKGSRVFRAFRRIVLWTIY